jgi:hypothetical protein
VGNHPGLPGPDFRSLTPDFRSDTGFPLTPDFLSGKNDALTPDFPDFRISAADTGFPLTPDFRLPDTGFPTPAFSLLTGHCLD